MNELNERGLQQYLAIKDYTLHKTTRKQTAIKLGISESTVSVLKAKYLVELLFVF
jgi:DNA-directed RNA polymerase specialized sigma subunit